MMIKVHVEDREGIIREIEVPTDVNLNMMEVLKAYEYPVLGTCGGMALCASCHVSVKRGAERVPEPGDPELEMLDSLPVVCATSRLACQIKVGDYLAGSHLKLMEVTD